MKRLLVLVSICLVLALILPGCGSQNETEPVAAEDTTSPIAPAETSAPTAVPATEPAPTAVSTPEPTPTAAPTPEPTPEIPLGEEFRSEEGGYVFLTIPGYEVEDYFGFTTMMGPDADPNLGPAIAFIGGVNEESATLEELFTTFQDEIAGDGGVEIVMAGEREVSVAGLPGMAANFSGSFEGADIGGRIVVALVTPTQPFTMFAAAPADSWEELAPLFDAVLASVSFFDPTTETTSSLAEPSPVPEAPEAETAAIEIRQWATGATASSEYGNPDWGAMQATGAPDTLSGECVDLPTAWASYDSDTVEWLELTYETPVVPTAINIFETHSPDQVVKVELIDLDGAYHEVYIGEPENLWDECPYTLAIPVDVDFVAVGVKVIIDQSIVPTTWNEIDAVELVGVAGEGGTAEMPPETGSGTAATDGELAIEALQGYEDIFGTWHIVGLVTNHSARDVDNIEIEVEVLDDSGNILFSDFAWTALYKLAPGETSSFRLPIYEELSGVDSFAANIVGHSAASVNRADVSVRGTVRTVDDAGNVHVTGEIVNNGSEPIAIDGMGVATFDEMGEIVTADSAMVKTGYLEPGDAGPFRFFMYGPAAGTDSIVDHAVYVDAVLALPEDAWTVSFSEEIWAYVDQYEDVHLVGEVTNASDETLDLRLLAAFYDAEGNVLDANTFSFPLDMEPGDTFPFDLDGGWAPLENTTGLSDRVASYTVRWDPYWTWPSLEVNVELATANDEFEFSNNTFAFTGQIVNSSDTAVDKAVIIIGLRDTVTGELVATNYDASFDEILPDAAVDYWVLIDLEPGYDESTLEPFYIVKGEQS